MMISSINESLKKALLFTLLMSANSQAAPPLPSGLKIETDKPALPSGLETDAPKLPQGLNKTRTQSEAVVSNDEPFISVNGFWDVRGGIRTQNDEHQEDFF